MHTCILTAYREKSPSRYSSWATLHLCYKHFWNSCCRIAFSVFQCWGIMKHILKNCDSDYRNWIQIKWKFPNEDYTDKIAFHTFKVWGFLSHRLNLDRARCRNHELAYLACILGSIIGHIFLFTKGWCLRGSRDNNRWRGYSWCRLGTCRWHSWGSNLPTVPLLLLHT